ncbi:hypothetical protein MTR67_006312 [Solanum verrucosum]|uniref:Uncharacterized protein n=1 Tax=Solanum verrucosum TaxID=315347 RepID=A0AAF0PXX8_SOLVR|nr:hypothetical protein MTR67_006312 [Solanum verrucosum]
MKVMASYLLGGNTSPSAADLKKILSLLMMIGLNSSLAVSGGAAEEKKEESDDDMGFEECFRMKGPVPFDFILGIFLSTY